MTTKRTPKVRKRRGSRTHGWGLVHRGSGQKGGAGNAGSGKKADCKKPSFWNRTFGRKGFKPKNPKHLKPEVGIRLQELEERLSAWLSAKQISREGDTYILDLTKLGYTKLLGGGRVTKKLKITTPAASASVLEKVKAAGGEVIIAQ